MDVTQGLGLLTAGVLLFWAVGAYNRLMRLRNEIARQFGPVQAQIERRHELLSQWAEALRPLLEHDPRPIEAVFAACNQVTAACHHAQQQPSAARPLGSLRLAEETLADARTRLLAELPAQVDRLLPGGAAMGTGMAVALLHEELAAVDSTLAFARHQFNNTTQDYNEAVLQFPTWIIAGVFGFRAAGVL